MIAAYYLCGNFSLHDPDIFPDDACIVPPSLLTK
jgi:hypothetical protein